MNVSEISKRIDEAKVTALRALEVPEETIASIHLASPPDPEMGDIGFPCFVLARTLRKAPPMIAAEVAEKVRAELEGEALFGEVKAVGPYVNVVFDAGELANVVVGEVIAGDEAYGAGIVADPARWMIEYSAPNTNKPQHLGHVRNNLLGAAVARILGFAGHDVTRVNLINDRGIHICKSMLAYALWGEGETPATTGTKGDHFVGAYYVRFAREFAAEYEAWLKTPAATDRYVEWLATQPEKKKAEQSDDELRAAFAKAYQDDYFNAESSLGSQAKSMLRDWEAGDPDVVELWNTMNGWVFEGFDQTYRRLGVGFDRVYRESQTYLLGKDVVIQGLEEGKFERLDDGAVVADMEALGLQGQKVLLRSDGTTVYMTQDLGTALARFDEYDVDRMVYVVGNEQDYHFQVLFKLLGLVRPELEGQMHHLSYGMVLLPEGKMKSREGKVVDADDLVDEMVELASDAIRERWPALGDDAVAERAEVIGLAALKYYILDFNPRTTVHFDPKKSIEFEGRTGPYCLYSYARIQSVAEKAGGWPELDEAASAEALRALGTEMETAVVRELLDWPRMVEQAVEGMDPSKITEQVFRLCKAYSSLYNHPDHKIIEIEGARRDGLLLLSRAVGEAIRTGLELLGIGVVEQM